MKLKYKFLTQPVPEGYIAITTEEDADKFHGIVRMNKTGMEIFDMLSSDQTEDSIVEALREKYADDDNTISGAAEPPVRSGESHRPGLTEHPAIIQSVQFTVLL